MRTNLGRTECTILQNKSGGDLLYGDVVIVDTANASAFTTTTTAAYIAGKVGVILDPNGIVDDGFGLIAFGGYVPQINLSASADIGDMVATHTVAGQGAAHAAPITAGDFCQVTTAGASPEALLFGAPVQATASGSELDYVEFTSPVTPTNTVEASADTVVTAGAVTFDGSTIAIIEFFALNARPAFDAAGRSITFWLFQDGSSIGSIGFISTPAASANNVPVHISRRMTPSAGSHTYSIRCTVNAGTGLVSASTGGAGAALPGFIRITRG